MGNTTSSRKYRKHKADSRATPTGAELDLDEASQLETVLKDA